MGTFKLFSSVNLLNSIRKLNVIAVRHTCDVTVAGKEIEIEKPIEDGKTGLVVGVHEHNGKFELTEAAKELDQKCDGKLSKHMNELSCELKLGKAFAVTNLTPEYSAIAIASYGPKDAGFNELESLDEASENVRWGVGAGVRLLAARGCGAVAVHAAGHDHAAAEAAELAAWRFQEFKSCSDRQAVPVVSGAAGSDGERWARGAGLGRAQNWARYLSDMPANKMAPVDFAQTVLDTLCELGVSVSAHDAAWLSRRRLAGVLAVARGSCEEPVLLEVQYRGAGPDQPNVLLAAKGVTFDSGGLCLKRREEMVENRGSMAGAAVTVAAIKVLAENKVPVNVSAVIPLCENMVSGQSMKVGDVITALNGTSIKIENTDMEGRLMLADALVYGQSEHRPALVVDVATFTSGVLTATGGGAFGAFCSDAGLWQALRRAGAVCGDRPWPLPLWDYYSNHITNDPSVDLRNQGSSRATPCVGAAFLRKFVCGPWVHLDITGVGKLSHGAAPYLTSRRMSGRPTRTLATFLQDMAQNKENKQT